MIHKLKILALLFISFLLSSLVSNTVFLAGRPDINYVFLAELRSSPGRFFQNTNEYVASIAGGKKKVESYQSSQVARQEQYFDDRETASYTAKGYEKSGNVYTKQDVAAKTVYIDIPDGGSEYELKSMTAGDGTEVQVWVPKGDAQAVGALATDP